MTPSAQLSRHQLLGASFSFQHLPMAEVAAILSRHGFREMELWGIAPHLDLFHTDDAKVAALRGLLADHGLTVRIFTPEQVVYPVNIASGDAALRRASPGIRPPKTMPRRFCASHRSRRASYSRWPIRSRRSCGARPRCRA